jgi:predicted acetyltransferase
VISLRQAFGAAPPTDEELKLAEPVLELDRTLAIFDGSEIVGTAGILSYRMTVPGGGSLPCGGVTRVSVRSTHRRRGLLTAMMRQQLDDMHAQGEPLAALYASEAPIYGRYGYGLATYSGVLEVDRARGAFAQPPNTSDDIAMVDVPTAVTAFTQVWERACPNQPGMLTLDERWWRYLLADLESHREGASPHYRVVYRAADGPAGFALYRIKLAWNASGPIGELRIQFLIAVTADAYAALWRYILDVDLIAKITGSMRPIDEPLRFLLADSRQPKMSMEDGIWLRLVDVGKALAGRRYARDNRLVLRVRDDFCAWNAGHFELNGGPSAAQCQACDDDPDLELDVADLAAVYLGGNRFRTLHEAGRVRELRSGAVARADAMFGTDRAPWCPSHF